MGRSRRLIALGLLTACTGEPPRSDRDATVLSRDDRDAPRMIAAHAATVAQLAETWGVARDAMPELAPIAEVPAPGGAPSTTIARFDQMIDGLPVEDGELRLLIRGGAIELASGTMVSTATPRSAPVFREPDAAAIARAVTHVYREPFDPASLAGGRLVAGRSGAIAVESARARRVWHRLGGALVAATVVEAYASRAGSTTGDAFRTVIAADTGAVLAHESLIADAFQYRVFAETTAERHPFDGPTTDATPHPTGMPDGSYPTLVAPNLVTVDGLNHPAGGAAADPWLAAGATETRGNNVDAYVDINPPTGLTDGDFRATTTATGVFDRTYNTASEPMVSQAQQMAGVVSLFFNINWLHDFWYDAGFTEAAGNAQASNLGRGGQEGDAILAEAQDNALGGSRNNANMATPADGMSPRMQVFLWTGEDGRKLTLAPQNRTPSVGAVSWAPGTYDTTAVVGLGLDATDPATDACEPLTNSAAVTGKIVLVDRGKCTVKTKVKNIQDAGGVGAIIANNVTGAAPSFTDDPTVTGVTIGTLTLSMDDGAQLRADATAGAVTATMHRKLHELDGTLDSTLVAHEYGHYLHHRLNRCSNAICGAMSEGWGDFNALLAMARPGDNLHGAYAFAIYSTIAFTDDAGYFGIRRAPYSVNFAINSLSFRHMADGTPLPTTHPFLVFGSNSEVHNAGEIWAATLWEVYVALHDQPGAVFDDVRTRMKRYVVSGLQMMPPDPTPLQARDALVAVADPADRPVMLAAFARRGMGSCAVAPTSDSTNFTGLVESTEIKGRAVAGAIALDDDASCDDDGVLDNGERATLTFTVGNIGHVALTGVTVKLTTTTPGVTIESAPLAIAELAPGASQQVSMIAAMDTSSTGPVAGHFAVEMTTPGGCAESITVPYDVALNTSVRRVASAIDSFDAASIWTANAAAWSQQARTPLDGAWHGADLAVASDTSLVSPPVHVGEEPFTVAFSHRYAFSHDATTSYDGGVVELSTDGGATWVDAATIAAPGYGGTIAPVTAPGGNPLAGRAAYVGASPGYPRFATVALELGTALANTDVLLRFRIGTDGAAGGPGWDIDRVGFAGITGTPFPALVPDDGTCGEPDPTEPPDDDGGCCSAAPPAPGALALGLGVLAAVLRRRRRA